MLLCKPSDCEYNPVVRSAGNAWGGPGCIWYGYGGPSGVLGNDLANVPFGVDAFGIGVVDFSVSLCFEDGVLELDDMLEWGLCDGKSFLEIFSIEFPFSLGDDVPLEVELAGTPSSLATSTTNSWSLFSPSLS